MTLTLNLEASKKLAELLGKDAPKSLFVIYTIDSPSSTVNNRVYRALASSGLLPVSEYYPVYTLSELLNPVLKAVGEKLKWEPMVAKRFLKKHKLVTSEDVTSEWLYHAHRILDLYCASETPEIGMEKISAEIIKLIYEKITE